MSEFSGLWYTKITSMHLYPRRSNVAAEVAEELKTVTYATPPMEERRKKKKGALFHVSLSSSCEAHSVAPGCWSGRSCEASLGDPGLSQRNQTPVINKSKHTRGYHINAF